MTFRVSFVAEKDDVKNPSEEDFKGDISDCYTLLESKGWFVFLIKEEKEDV